MKRIVIILLLIAAISAGVVYYQRTVRSGDTVLTGIVTTDSIIVSAQIQGRLDSLDVKQGDAVKKGQVIGRIAPQQWQADMSYYSSSAEQAATRVAQAQADLRYQQAQTINQIHQSQANLDAARAQVVQGEADLESARLTYEREDDLFKQHAETAQAHDQAKAAFDGQKARVDALRKQVVAAEAALEMAKSNVEQTAVRQADLDAMVHQSAAAAAQQEKAKVQLGYTELRSPADGIVDVRAALPGEVVNPAQAIVTIINPDDLWVRVDVEESLIDQIHIGDKLAVRLPYGTERSGTVFYRGIDADYATQRDVSRTKRDIRTFEVRLRCDNADRSLAVGMTAYVTLPAMKSG